MNGKKSFAEEYEIVESTTTADINGAIRAASAHAGDPCSARREASRLCPAGGIVEGDEARQPPMAPMSWRSRPSGWRTWPCN